jgi:hypothetical protein
VPENTLFVLELRFLDPAKGPGWLLSDCRTIRGHKRSQQWCNLHVAGAEASEGGSIAGVALSSRRDARRPVAATDTAAEAVEEARVGGPSQGLWPPTTFFVAGLSGTHTQAGMPA